MKRAAAGAAGALALVAVGYGVARGQLGGAGAALPPLYYGGTLERAGQAVTGEHELRVSLYPAEKAGAALCESVQRAEVDDGRFRVPLSDARCRAVIAADAELWVEVQLDRDPALPRARIGAVPYAAKAAQATSAAALDERCVGCVDAAKIGSIPAEKITGVLTQAQGGAGEGAWIQPAEEGFANYAPDHAPFAYRKDGSTVRLRGLVKLLKNENVFVLPEGFRPLKREIFLQAGATDRHLLVRVDVAESGHVQALDPSGPKLGWVSLAGITFRVD